MSRERIGWTQAELWQDVQRVRVGLGLSLADVAREARLKPETLASFETRGGTGPALRRVKYAIERLIKRSAGGVA
jgi:hypothetical protein